MAEITSSGSLSRDRTARTLFRNRREIDRASLTAVSRTIAVSDIGSCNRSRRESESMTITSSSVPWENETRFATEPKLPANWKSRWLRTMLSSPTRRTAEVAATATRIAPPPRFDIRYRVLWPNATETALISPARINLICRTSPIFAVASESWIASTCSTVFPPHFEKKVSQQHSGLLPGPTVLDVHDKQPDSRFSLQLRAHIFRHLHRLHRDTQIRPSDMPLFQEFFDNTIHGCHWQRHGSSMGQAPRIDADDFAPGIEQRSTGKSRIQGEVEPDVLIEFSPELISPLAADAANDPTARH